MPDHIAAPKNFPPFRAMKDDVAGQLVGSGSQIPKGAGGPSNQVPRGAQMAPSESGLRTRSVRKLIVLEDEVPALEVESLRQVEGTKKNKCPSSSHPVFPFVTFFLLFFFGSNRQSCLFRVLEVQPNKLFDQQVLLKRFR